MKNERRPVEVRTMYISGVNMMGEKDVKIRKYNAIFHGFGQEEVSFGNDGFKTVTVAIVEDENGYLKTVNPNHIQFLDVMQSEINKRLGKVSDPPSPSEPIKRKESEQPRHDTGPR